MTHKEGNNSLNQFQKTQYPVKINFLIYKTNQLTIKAEIKKIKLQKTKLIQYKALLKVKIKIIKQIPFR